MDINSVDLNLLLAFEALITEHGVTRAGQRIGLSQPAMSNALARLRVLLGDRLFVPAGREMVPTARALQLAPPLLEALSKIRTAIGDQRTFDPRTATLTIRVATTDYAEIVFLSRCVRAVRQEAPGVNLSIVRLEGLFEIPTAKLLDGSLHFALGLFPQPIVPGTGIASHALFDDPWVCVARASHPKIKGKLTLTDFLRIEHIRVSYGPPERSGFIGEALATIGRNRRIGLTVPHLATVPAIAARTDFVGIVPLLLAEEYRRALRLRLYPIPLRLPRTTMALLWHERNQHDPAHRWIRSALARLSKQLGLRSPEAANH